LELYVRNTVLWRLDSPHLAKLLSPRDQGGDQVDMLVLDVNEKQHRVDDLVDDYANGLLDRAQFARAKLGAEAALQAAQARLQDSLSKSCSLPINVGERLADAWERNNLDWRRQLLGLVIERVIVHPSDAHMKNSERYHGFRFRPADVEIRWRV
jgi:site-specific DNA recombinase